MDFAFGKDEEDFRNEVRKFVRDKPPDMFPCQIENEGYGFGGWSREYTRELGRKGWLALCWPKEYGGQGLSFGYRFILADELAYNRAPQMAHFFNDSVGPSIITHGTPELKRLFLPQMVRGDILFCTPLSEPQAGSDLLSLKLQALENDGGDFILNGQKLWSTGAFLADWGMVLAQTDPNAPRSRRISALLVDMKSPGITVKPLTDVTGSQSLTEIFFDDVHVPKKNLLGERNQGIDLMLESLEGDRLWARCVRAASAKRDLEDLVAYQRTQTGRDSTQECKIRTSLADLAVKIEVCSVLCFRVLWMVDKGIPLTHEASILKTFADELGQHLANLAIRLLGLHGLLLKESKWAPFGGCFGHQYLFSPGYTLAGGTSEIQRTTIARRGLGLP